ncbi:glycogen/starch/alpha-glucan phosphorylase [Pseudomonas huanghezhanensis]|uniref:glycogen/starch/alpha-glucan phosphorylase n=1 Tax=Pseudomonas huanghezhanensis TaxID=3002903 RepID=UPI0022869201|nr:glycogen/starch/alpha-glucan phosphorylase [Pseudomonas sp. BSw22131]
MSPEPNVRDAEVAAFREAVLNKLEYAVGKDPDHAFDHDWFMAIALATRDKMAERWMNHTRYIYKQEKKRVYYLSLEFLIGRLMFDSLSNLGILETARVALKGLNVDLEKIRTLEPDAALGNGGLGRLAACFMESMSTLGVAGHGYGIRYEHGLFRQNIVDGWQQEQTENWLDFGNPWEFERPEVIYQIGFGGSVQPVLDSNGAPMLDAAGETRQVWHAGETVRAIAYDTPVVGWRGKAVNTLRLWRARAVENLHLERFNAGDHVGAVAEVVRAESISRVLYPNDSTEAGQELRLRQEYFFVSASLQDLLRRHKNMDYTINSLPEHAAIQMNDTHPSIAVAELMRILIDLHDVEWAEAWRITVGTLAYTNHTLLPEALETWPVGLMERMLPRHMQIIYMINAQLIDHVRESQKDDPELFDLLRAVSLIEEDNGRRVRMGNLAFIGSHSTNGVSALHTQLMRKTVFAQLHKLHPDRINNKTNGITFRRWLFQSNPELTSMLVKELGEQVLDNHETALLKLEPFADKPAFQKQFAEQRLQSKTALAAIIQERMGITVNPAAMFDVQVKRIHEYKRQLLNLFHTVALYQAMRADPSTNWAPRVKIFAGKAAASYHSAKLIIKLANDIARTVNNDPTLRGQLKVVFMPNYNVSLAESIIPAADLSEQISTAGLEASGTSNMKFGLNGALTIGTLDGANVEMSEQVGLEHMFIFGMSAQEVEARKHAGEFNAHGDIAASGRLNDVLQAIRGGVFSPDDPYRYAGLIDQLIAYDRFFVCADFESYWHAQAKVEAHWHKPEEWWRSAVLNTSRMGWFSSDRTIREYATDIWKALD